MSDENAVFHGELVLSRHLDYFRNGDEYFVYHNLFGYILKMSEDVIEFLEFFRNEPRDAHAVVEVFHGRFEEQMLTQFATVLTAQHCLLPAEVREESLLLDQHPVHARWTVYHEPAEGPVKVHAFDRTSETDVLVAELDAWDSNLWRRIDGEVTCAELIEQMREVEGSPVTGLEERVFATLGKLTHSDMQVLKMSAKPASTYKNRRHGTPPYLISTMPYDKITAQVVGGGGELRVPMPGLKREPIDPALLARDQIENTLSFLFRDPHPGLGGDTYGARLLAYLAGDARAAFSGQILEVGGSTGALARSYLDALRERHPERYAETHYTLLHPDQGLADEARQRLSEGGHERVEVLFADPMSLDQTLAGRAFDLILCNEFAAGLETVPVRKFQPEVEEVEDEETGEAEPTNGHSRNDLYLAEGDSINVIFRLNLPLDDSPLDFFLNLGAIKLLERATAMLSPDGQLCFIEFGEIYRYPVRAAEGETPQFSIHFGHMLHVLKHLGFSTDFGYLMEKLEFARDMPMLATTRSHYKALRNLLSHAGHALERRAYNQDEFEALLRGAGLDPQAVHDITYEPLEDRVMGLVSHSFKVLRALPPEPPAEPAPAGVAEVADTLEDVEL